jgi:hypothetical protein
VLATPDQGIAVDLAPRPLTWNGGGDSRAVT